MSRARVSSPAAACLASAVSRAVSATDSRMAAMRGGQGCPPRAGQWRVAERDAQVSVADVLVAGGAAAVAGIAGAGGGAG